MAQASIVDAFIRRANEEPDRLFVRLSKRGSATEYATGDMMTLAGRYNSAFRDRPLPSGSVIAIVLDHSADLYAAFLGAILAGHVPTILPPLTAKQSPELYWSSHAALFALTGISAVVTFAANEEALRTYVGRQVDHVWTCEAVRNVASSDAVSRTEIALLQHSSGTTGLKKGVMLGHEAILNQVDAYARAIGLAPDSRIVSWLPLYHDMGLVACFLVPLVLGCPISHLDALEWSAQPTLLLDELVRFGGQFAWMPNFGFHHIAGRIRAGASWDLSGVRALISCSEPCKPETFARFRAHPALSSLPPHALQTCYAMAENVFAVTQSDLRAQPRTVTISQASFRTGETVELAPACDAEGDNGIGVLSCGPPIDGVKIDIRLPDGAGAPTERVFGEIAVSGDSLYAGYYRRPEVTAKALLGGWHRTGDTGFLYEGELYILGRIDDLMIIRGKNIYAHEIEDLVNALRIFMAGRVVAFSAHDASLGTDELIVAGEIAVACDPAVSKRRIRDLIEMETGVAVAQIYFVTPGTLIKTTSGKLSRSLNRRKLMEQAHA